MERLQTDQDYMEWGLLRNSKNFFEDLLVFPNNNSHILSDYDVYVICGMLGYERKTLSCPNCKADEEHMRLDLQQSQNICTVCAFTFPCSFESVLKHPEIARQIQNRPWEETECAIEQHVYKPYDPSENFRRYITSRIKGWSFKCTKREERHIVRAMLASENMSLTKFRKICKDLNLKKYWQRYHQFLSIAFPEMKENLLMEFDSEYIRRLVKMHRNYVYAFKHVKEQMNCECFPNRGYTACFFLYKFKPLWKYIRYMNLPRLRDTAVLNQWRLRVIELKLVAIGRMKLEEIGNSFPIELFYNEQGRLKKEYPTEREIEQYTFNQRQQQQQQPLLGSDQERSSKRHRID